MDTFDKDNSKDGQADKKTDTHRNRDSNPCTHIQTRDVFHDFQP
jgi:hypothetical protein